MIGTLAALLMEWERQQRDERFVGCYSFHDDEARQIAEHLARRGVTTRQGVLEALWNGDIQLTAEQRKWIRQALDVQEARKIRGVNNGSVG